MILRAKNVAFIAMELGTGSAHCCVLTLYNGFLWLAMTGIKTPLGCLLTFFLP